MYLRRPAPAQQAGEGAETCDADVNVGAIKCVEEGTAIMTNVAFEFNSELASTLLN